VRPGQSQKAEVRGVKSAVRTVNAAADAPGPVRTPCNRGAKVPFEFWLWPRTLSVLLPLLQGRYVLSFLRDALRGLKGLPLAGSLRMLWLGFLPDKQLMYGLGARPSAQQTRLFVTDAQARRMKFSSAARLRYRRLLDDKVRFAELVGSLGSTPEILAVIECGRVFPTSADVPTPDAAGLAAAARTHGGLVFKPRDCGGGAGVFLLEGRTRCPAGAAGAKSEVRGQSSEAGGTDGLLLDRMPVESADLEERISRLDSYIVTPMVKQAEYAAALFAKTTNTIRVLTMIDPVSGEAFVAGALQRIGTEQRNRKL